MEKKTLILCIISALFVIVGFGAYMVNTYVFNFFGDPPLSFLNQNLKNDDSYEKYITEIGRLTPTFGAIAELFTHVAQTEGGVYAFELLRRAPLPPDIDVHLLGHVIGDELYKQEGLDGMLYCTPDFRNACSHTIVIGALLENGLGVFDEVNDVCKKAPGGIGAYTMCFHGFGHGVLAYTQYEMPDAVELCRKVGTEAYNQNEFHQCVGGMVMEMRQGIHDPEVWSTKKDKYLDVQDPFKLCASNYMPEEAKFFCYTYITPYIFDAAGAVRGNPTPDIFEVSFQYCEQTEKQWRLVCYEGIGKEFVVLAQDRDVRSVDQMTDDRLEKVIQWCDLAKVTDGTEACVQSAQNSLYWGGENDFNVSIRFCSAIPSGDLRLSCFKNMFGNVSYYEQNQQIKQEICESVPSEFKSICTSLVQ